MVIKKLAGSSHSLIKPPDSQQLKSGYVVLNRGEEIGEHTTSDKEELITILSGTATVIVENEIERVTAHHVVYIPEGKKHTIKNEGTEILTYVYTVAPLR